MAQQSTIGTHRTSKVRVDNKLMVVYHSTPVVQITNNRYVKLNTGGWYTATTKTRMNQASNEYGLGFSVYQKNFDWFVVIGDNTYEYYDNIIIDIDKEVIVKD
jgi:uncharacterized protein YcnI